MNKQQAMKEAARRVMITDGREVDGAWLVSAPEDLRHMDGPRVFYREETYREAKTMAAAIKARLALNLLGKMNSSVEMAVGFASHAWPPVASTKELVEIGLQTYASQEGALQEMADQATEMGWY